MVKEKVGMNDQQFRDALIAHMARAEQQMAQLDKHVVEIKASLNKGDNRMDKMDERMDGFDKQVSYLRGAWAVIGFVFALVLAWLKGIGK